MIKNYKISKIQNIVNYTYINTLSLINISLQKWYNNNINLINLKKLQIKKCKINIVPHFIKKLKNLNSLSLKNNNIKMIPVFIFEFNIKKLNISNNKIRILSININKLILLKKLNISNNKIKIIPDIIINLLFLKKIKYENNPINNLQILTNFMIEMDINNNRKLNEIEKNINKNFINILEHSCIKKKILIENILNDPILNTLTKNILIEYCKPINYYCRLKKYYSKILKYLWNRIELSKDCVKIKKTMNKKIKKSLCVCIYGKIGRLIKCFVKFFDDIKRYISSKDIGKVIINIKNELNNRNCYSIKKHKKESFKKIIALGYNYDIANLWTSYIE